MGPERPGSTVVDPDRLAALEEERSFLLRSLRDLDAEHVAGDVDEQDYTALRDGYTKRAADVLREIEDGRARLPAPRPTGWPRRIGIVAAVVAVAVVAGMLVARSSGDRLTGDEITGDAPDGGVAAMLAEARLTRAVDPLAAMELYGDVLEVDPGHAEALTYSGWLLLFVGQQSSDEGVVRRLPSTGRGAADRGRRRRSHPPRPALLPVDHRGRARRRRRSRPVRGSHVIELGPPADLRAETESYLAQLD